MVKDTYNKSFNFKILEVHISSCNLNALQFNLSEKCEFDMFSFVHLSLLRKMRYKGQNCYDIRQNIVFEMFVLHFNVLFILEASSSKVSKSGIIKMWE